MPDLMEKVDVESLINSAFKELECIAPTNVCDHGGDTAAYFKFHGGCVEGWVCKTHYDYWINQVQATPIVLPMYCSRCMTGPYFTWAEWVKIYPL